MSIVSDGDFAGLDRARVTPVVEDEGSKAETLGDTAKVKYCQTNAITANAVVHWVLQDLDDQFDGEWNALPKESRV